MGIASLNPSYDGRGVERRTPHLFRRRHDVDLPADRRTGVPMEEALCGDRKLLGVLAVLPHPGLADRQPPVRGIADADKAEPLGLFERGESRGPDLARRERRRMIRTVERHRLADLRGGCEERPSRGGTGMPGLAQLAGQIRTGTTTPCAAEI